MTLKLIVLAGLLSLAGAVGPCQEGPAAGGIEHLNTASPTAISDPSSQSTDLKIIIEGIRSDSGTIMIGLYDSSEGFEAAIKRSAEAGLLNDKGRLAGETLRAAKGMQSIIFTQLRPGRYAVIVFHDENDNGRLDENGWGVPTEGYGFSNDAQGLLSAPAFDAAGVTLEGKDQSVAISLIYPKVLEQSVLRDSPD